MGIHTDSKINHPVANDKNLTGRNANSATIEEKK